MQVFRLRRVVAARRDYGDGDFSVNEGSRILVCRPCHHVQYRVRHRAVSGVGGMDGIRWRGRERQYASWAGRASYTIAVSRLRLSRAHDMYPPSLFTRHEGLESRGGGIRDYL